MIALVVLATQLRGIVGGAWLATAVDAGIGMRAIVQVLGRALTVDLGILVVAALILYAAGGPKRNLGRTFDLACVAVLPLFFVALGATVIVRAIELAGAHVDMPPLASMALAGISYAWTGALVALAVRPSRSASRSAGHAKAGAIVLAVAVLGIALQVAWLARNMESVRPMIDGDPAPEFSLPTVAKGGALGPPVSLAQYKGKIVVVDFWATWCGPCLRAMPKLETLARRTTGDVVVIAVNLDDPAKARAMFDEGGYRMQLVADDGNASTRYGVSTIPHSVVIDREGIVRHVYRGGSSQITPDVEALAKR